MLFRCSYLFERNFLFNYLHSSHFSELMNHEILLFSCQPDFLGLDSNESITRRLNVATARSPRSRHEHRPSAHHLHGVRARTSATRTHCLHFSKSRRNHLRKHIAKIAGNLAHIRQSPAIANCKFIFSQPLHLHILNFFPLNTVDVTVPTWH